MKLFCLLALSLLCPCLGQQFLITQDPAECSTFDGGCSTLNEQVSSPSAFTSNSVVRFASGTHTLTVSETSTFWVRDVHNLTLAGDENGSCEILCRERMMFVFSNVTRITISNLSFINCGAPLTEQVLSETVNTSIQVRVLFLLTNETQIALFFFETDCLEMSYVQVLNSTRYGTVGINMMGDSLITHSDFSFSNYRGSELCSKIERTQLTDCLGGGLLIGYSDGHSCDVNQELHTLTITSTYFRFNNNFLRTGFGAGVGVIMAQSSYGMKVLMDNVTALGNSADLGANIGILHFNIVRNSSFTISNSRTERSNIVFQSSATFFLLNDDDILGGGFWCTYGFRFPDILPTCSIPSGHQKGNLLTVSNTTFRDNQATVGAGVYVVIIPGQRDGLDISFEECHFLHNTGSPGSALYVNQIREIEQRVVVRLNFRDCIFEHNNVFNELNQEVEFDILNAVFFNTVQDVTIEHCQFKDNSGSAVFAYDSRLRFYGISSSFEGNHGIDGGGLSLHGNSIIILSPNTSISFVNNSAVRGGAIFVSNQNYRSALICFWQPDIEDEYSTQVTDIPATFNMEITFSGNQADSAGSALFGGSVDNCILSFDAHYDSEILFNSLFKINESPELDFEASNISEISSEPNRVCICSIEQPLVCNITASISIFPGETIEVGLITVGQRKNPSPGIVNSHLKCTGQRKDDVNIHTANSSHLGLGQDAQTVLGTCTMLQYTIFSTEEALSLEFTTENTVLEETVTNIEIALKDCPVGFYLITDPPGCNCTQFVTDRGIQCNIEGQTIYRVSPIWIGTKSADIIQASLFCPFDYCIPNDINIFFPDDQEKQCAYNRTGTLCGMCKPGLSVIFGGNECYQCSNVYLLLLAVFAVAGFVLVIALFFFDTLTVSAGTINGLIFYANIIQINKAIFFPAGHENPPNVFIAWLNLDLGIRTCFYDGMDTYVKTWLQFAFPLYILAILACIVIVSNYSTTVSKAFSCRAVGVLATIIILSFSRLQRVMINCLSPVVVDHSDGSSTNVWRFDGNLEYLSGIHVALFIAGLILLLILVPFIIALLFAKQFQALSSYRYFCWVNKTTPLFDAFTGSYKDKYLWWTGLLLLVRQILIAVSIGVDEPARNMLATAILPQLLSLFTCFSGGVYKKWPMNVFEFSFLLNLSITSTATLFIRSLPSEHQVENQSAVIYTSVVIAFVEFVIIVLYSLCRKIIDSTSQVACFVKFQQCVIAITHLPDKLSRLFSRKKQKNDTERKISTASSNGTVTSTVIDLQRRDSFSERSVIALRESLLDLNQSSRV